MAKDMSSQGPDETKPATKSGWNGQQYAADPRAAYPSTDKSSQDGAGLGNGGK